MKAFFHVVIATFTCACSFITCQEQYYSLTSVEAGVGGCPATKDYVERIRQGVDSLIENVLLPTLIIPHHHLSAMTTSVRLVCRQVKVCAILPSIC